MKKMIFISLLTCFIGFQVTPSMAASYIIGIGEYWQSPDCNDPYATTCTRPKEARKEGERGPRFIPSKSRKKSYGLRKGIKGVEK